jgi:hypothetical protein
MTPTKGKFPKPTQQYPSHRIPTMLLNSEQCPSQLNLQHYTILDCEPLHDIKGHFLNLLSELPYLFKGDDRNTV